MDLLDTICAPATVPGTGALTLIRVSGPDAHAIVDKIFRSHQGRVQDAAAYSLLYGVITGEGSGIIDEVLVSVFRAPHSYTGEDGVEISCHASSYIAGRILERLCAEGARPAEAGEFTRRAFVNGKMDLAQAEAVADLIASHSTASHRLAMTQLKGGVSHELSRIRASLLEITSLLELELDFSEEDVRFADRRQLRALLASASDRIRTLADSFHLGNAIKEGVPVVIVGEPNTGKSTLLNALLGEDRALVSDLAGTTRDSIEEPFTLEGIRFRFIDTAGLRDSRERIEAMGIERTLKLMGRADIILAMVDATLSPAAAIRSLKDISGRIDPSLQKLIILVNKADEAEDVGRFSRTVSEAFPGSDIRIISALRGPGLPELRHALAQSVKDRISGAGETLLITNTRHHEALRRCAEALDDARSALDTALPADLVAQDLRAALHHLGTITGEITTDEVLGEIFSRFCIGK